jgi:hypothetical protein
MVALIRPQVADLPPSQSGGELLNLAYCHGMPPLEVSRERIQRTNMAKPHRKLKKANHGKRPSNSKARKAKRHMVKT